MIQSARALTEITREAIELLSREMGVGDTLRFLNQFAPGSGDYTRERETLFTGESIASLVAQMRSLEAEGTT